MISRTGNKKFHNNCEKCKYFHVEVREGGGWLEICEATGGRVIGSDEGFDNCPFTGTIEEAKADSGRE